MFINKRKIIFLPYIILIGVFSLTVSILTRQSLSTGIGFALFQMFAIILPGFVIVKILKLDTDSDVKCLGMSYFMGYCANMLIYLCIVPFHLQDYSVFFLLGIDIACIIYLFHNKKTDQIFKGEKDEFGRKVCLLFIIIYLLFEFMTYTLDKAIPPIVDNNIVYWDLSYWVGNTIELTKEFPPKNFRSYPASYNYHYFTSMQLAFVSLVTKIRPVYLSLVYQYIQPVFLVIFGSYILFKEHAKKNILVVVGIIILLFTSGFESISIVAYREHMFDMPFGFDYGMGIFLFYIYFLLKIYYSERFSWKYCLISLFCFACLMGVKAPFAAIAIVGTGIMSLVWLFRKDWKKVFLVGMPTLLIFIALYLGVVNVSGYSGGDPISVISKAPPAERGDIRAVNNKTESAFILGKIALLLYYGIMCNPVIFVLILSSFFICIIKKRPLAKGSIVLLFMMFIAELLTLFIGMDGNSQMYFIMCVYPIGILLYVMNTEIEIDSKIYRLILLFLMLFGIVKWNEGYEVRFVDVCRNSISNLIVGREVDLSQNHSISLSQMEAYEWLREHSNQNTQVFSNKGDGLIGIISECYLHGGTALFESDSEREQDEYIAQIKEMNCEYIVYDIAKAPYFKMLSNKCKVVFSNQSTVIYEIN